MTNRDISSTSCQAFMPSSIHLSLCLYFLQLLMQQPEQKQSYLCDNSPPPLGQLMHLLVLCITPSPFPRPQPLFLFQFSLKTSFLPISFPPHICTSITWPRESCGLHSGCCLGEEKRSVCQSPFLRGQRSAPLSFDLPLISGTT